MKTKSITLLIVLVLACINIKAQSNFNNNSFEQWNNSTLIPVNWNGVILEMPFVGEINLTGISKSNQSVDGNYSVQLQPFHISSAYTSFLPEEWLGKIYIPSMITNATINVGLSNLMSLLSVFANGEADLSDIANSEFINSLLNVLSGGVKIPSADKKVQSVSGFYDFSPKSDADGFVIAVLLVKTENQQRTIAGGGVYNMNQATDGFAPFVVPVTYIDDATEVVFVALSTCSDQDAAQAGTLKIDNLQINWEGAINGVLADESTIYAYPNPTADKSVRLSLSGKQDVNIFNQEGKLIKTVYNYVPQTDINFDNPGVYFVSCKEKTVKVVVK
ncbi:MAG: T9SS type A sorting domain-containing protein [Bacteroidales bacterium]|nr:T9SS type A sorting domain-containing protein [Bacteroidales bacterium]